ncbi:MAG: toprim domain-containing protein, partial [Pseudomonadota bacterium]
MKEIVLATPPHVNEKIPNKAEYYRTITELDIVDIARVLFAGRITRDGGDFLLIDCTRHASASHTSLRVDGGSKQRWFCFGCNVGGDVLQLVEFYQAGCVTRHVKGQPMSDTHRAARDWLAARRGLPPLSQLVGGDERDVARIEAEHARNEDAYAALEGLSEYCHERLLAPENEEVLEWLKSNYAISDDTILSLKIGYSDNQFTDKNPLGILKILTEPPYDLTHEQMARSGAFSLNPTRNIKLSPLFDRRIVFPYWSRGRVVYGIGRKTPWTPDTEFEKGKYKKLLTWNEHNHSYVARGISNSCLYNEDILSARPAPEYVIVVEGITDAIALHERGFPVISPVTTRIKSDDLKRIVPKLRSIKSVLFCLDSEESGTGLKAALDGARLLSEHGITAKLIILPRPEGVEKVDANSWFFERRELENGGVAEFQ